MVTRVKTVARNITPGPESSFRALPRAFVRKVRGRIESFSNHFRIVFESVSNRIRIRVLKIESTCTPWGSLRGPHWERIESGDLAAEKLNNGASRLV